MQDLSSEVSYRVKIVHNGNGHIIPLTTYAQTKSEARTLSGLVKLLSPLFLPERDGQGLSLVARLTSSTEPLHRTESSREAEYSVELYPTEGELEHHPDKLPRYRGRLHIQKIDIEYAGTHMRIIYSGKAVYRGSNYVNVSLLPKITS